MAFPYFALQHLPALTPKVSDKTFSFYFHSSDLGQMSCLGAATTPKYPLLEAKLAAAFQVELSSARFTTVTV